MNEPMMDLLHSLANECLNEGIATEKSYEALKLLDEAGYDVCSYYYNSTQSERVDKPSKTEYRQKFSVGSHMASTLPPECIGTNDSGWTISGEIIQEDYYRWVNEFSAHHPEFGWVKGDFEDEVISSSKEAYEHFVKHHPPEDWDYWDI